MVGYGWAGMFKKYLVDPVEMWWPSNVSQVALFRYACLIFPLTSINLDIVQNDDLLS